MLSRASPSETQAVDVAKGKEYVGIITKVPREICSTIYPTGALTCYDRRSWTRGPRRARRSAGRYIRPLFIGMSRYLGHEAWRAPSPTDPKHLPHFWVSDSGRLISSPWRKPESVRSRNAAPRRPVQRRASRSRKSLFCEQRCVKRVAGVTIVQKLVSGHLCFDWRGRGPGHHRDRV